MVNAKKRRAPRSYSDSESESESELMEPGLPLAKRYGAGASPTSPRKKAKKKEKLRPGLEKNLVRIQQNLLKEKKAGSNGGSAVGGGGGGDLSDARKMKFTRALASTDWHTRERALRSLELWLSMQDEVSAKDLRKIWKGLFFSFWHSDKQQVQQELAERLSNLVCTLEPPQVALSFWESFLDTMAREWSSIDRLRLDKFMSLVRMFVHACLMRMCVRDWHPEVVVPMWELLSNTLVQVNQPGHVMTGLALHLAHVFVDELEQVCVKAGSHSTSHAAASKADAASDSDSSIDSDDSEDPEESNSSDGDGGDSSSGDEEGEGLELPDTIPSDVLSYFVEPFKNLLCECSSLAVVNRVVEEVYVKLMRKTSNCLKEIERGGDVSSEAVRGGYPFVQLDAIAMAQELFEIAADERTRQFNREKIYDVVSVVEDLAAFQKDLQQATTLPSTPETPNDAPFTESRLEWLESLESEESEESEESPGRRKKRKRDKKHRGGGDKAGNGGGGGAKKKKKKGVVWQLSNNQIKFFHKKNQAKVTYSPSPHVPKKGALKRT